MISLPEEIQEILVVTETAEMIPAEEGTLTELKGATLVITPVTVTDQVLQNGPW